MEFVSNGTPRRRSRGALISARVLAALAIAAFGTGCGGEGGVVEAVAVSAAGGGVGRATGCCFFPHARTVPIRTIKRHAVFNSARRIMFTPCSLTPKH